jgi:hypothetical protein
MLIHTVKSADNLNNETSEIWLIVMQQRHFRQKEYIGF